MYLAAPWRTRGEHEDSHRFGWGQRALSGPLHSVQDRGEAAGDGRFRRGSEMTIYWPQAQDESTSDSENTASVFELPEGVLQRHGARMLRRTTATRARIARISGAPVQRSTAYVSSVLLIPGSLMETEEQLTKLNDALKAAEVEIADSHDPDQSDVTRTAALQPVPTRGARPVDVDAWTALQAIRDVDPDLGLQISLDHLMVVSAAGDLSGVPGAIQGFISPFGLQGPVASG